MKSKSAQAVLLWGLTLSLMLATIRCQCYKDQVSTLSAQTLARKSGGSEAKIGTRPHPTRFAVSMPQDELGVDQFVVLSHEAKMTLNGEALRSRQRELARVAVSKLGCSNELIELRSELYETGVESSVTQDLVNGAIAEGLPDLLNQDQMHQWATIKNLNLRANLSALIGQKIAREDLDALIAMDGMDKGSTEGLVAGFAEKLNNNDPMLGIKFYLERFPDGQLIHDLLRRLPPDAPFGDILPLIRGSSVQSPEKQLFARWAEISPDQAAQFVTGNLDTVRIESVEVLLRKWGGIRGGSSASEWVRALPPGPVRDKSASLLGFQLSEI